MGLLQNPDPKSGEQQLLFFFRFTGHFLILRRWLFFFLFLSSESFLLFFAYLFAFLGKPLGTWLSEFLGLQILRSLPEFIQPAGLEISEKLCDVKAEEFQCNLHCHLVKASSVESVTSVVLLDDAKDAFYLNAPVDTHFDSLRRQKILPRILFIFFLFLHHFENLEILVLPFHVFLAEGHIRTAVAAFHPEEDRLGISRMPVFDGRLRPHIAAKACQRSVAVEAEAVRIAACHVSLP